MTHNKYIPLTILDSNDNKINIQEIVKNRINIILGQPGGGKTTLLEHYKNSNSQDKIQLLDVKQLLKFPNCIEHQIDILLLDGIDEYRIASQDSTFVAEELGYKISEILQKQSNLKIILTCREMDWFGEDNDKLEQYINEKVEIFYLQPLDSDQQSKFVNLLVDKKQEEFLEKFKNSNFLTNPQLLYMLSEIWKNENVNLTSKTDIYQAFIKTAIKECNKQHSTHQKYLEEQQALRLLGYLSYFYFFCGIEKFEPEVLKHISTEEYGYSYDLLNQMIQTKLFSKRNFIHKTVAEFTLAYHTVEFQLKKHYWDLEKIKTLFVNKNGKISSRLRGAYAWLCSLSKNKEFIEIDPYYQAIYGDNSLFDIEQKKFVLEAVREYSQLNPYFINFAQHLDLKGFYVQELDKTLMTEYDKAIKLDNHYIYFLGYIITQGHDVSKNMEDFIQSKIRDDISYYYKTELLKYFEKKDNKVFLREILDLIIDKKISDEENSLKDLLLGFLYPSNISPQEIIAYLLSYKKTDTLYPYYLYLFKTPFDEKRSLVEVILNNKDQLNHKKYSSLPYYIDDFIKDFFFDVYLNLASVEEIYECLTHFQDKYFQDTLIEIKPFGQTRKNEEKAKQTNLEELSNQLFKINVRKQLFKINERKQPFDNLFSYHIFNFPYYSPPTNVSETLLPILKETRNRKEKKTLFFTWLNSPHQEKKNKDECQKIAKENGLELEYNEYISKQEQRDKEYKKQEQERQEKIKKEQDGIEKFFKEKKIEDLISDFKVMYWIAELYLYRQNDIGSIITRETFEKKLKKILQDFLYIKPCPFPDSTLTIHELSKQPQNSIRNIDSVYYASICANEQKWDLKNLNLKFKSYLYIIALQNDNMINTNTSFCSYLEQTDKNFALDTLKKYIKLLINRLFNKKKIGKVILQRIQEETEIKTIKIFAQLCENDSNLPTKLILQFLTSFGFLLSIEELKILNNQCIGEKNHQTVQALQNLHNNTSQDIETALSLFSLLDVFPKSEERFQALDNQLKIKILTYLMNAFNTQELLKEQRSTSAMSKRDLCVYFLKYEALKRINKKDLKILLNHFGDTIWKNKILYEINNDEAIENDEIDTYKIDEIKKMIIQNFTINSKMFFEETYLKLKELGKEIEANEDNEKSAFYNTIEGHNGPKKEEEIRDVIFNFLKRQYKSDTLWIREKYEANKRVDIHAKYHNNPNFHVQIECKKDSYKESPKKVIDGIKTQLIDQYLKAENSFGIYLIFYFRESNYSKEEWLNLLSNEVKARGYEERVKILIIDFSLP